MTASLDERFAIIFELIGLLDEAYLSDTGVAEKGLLFHQFMIAVSPKFKGRGLATRILEANLDLGGARGFRTAVIECIGWFSLAADKKCGYTFQHEIGYEGWESKSGAKPFAGTEAAMGHTCATVCSLSLRSDIATTRMSNIGLDEPAPPNRLFASMPLWETCDAL